MRAGYGDAVVLDGISFDLADKGSLAVLGRNGVGKSTLLLTIMGFTRHDARYHSLAGRRYHPGRAASNARAAASAGWRRNARSFRR